MLSVGPARKVTIHLNEDTSSSTDFLYRDIFAFLLNAGVSGATLIRPEAGFGSHHRAHVQHGESVQREHLPVRVEFIESVERVQALLPELCRLTTDGLIEVHDTTIVKLASEEPAPL
jgi:PII-like signaling protein